MPAVEKLKQIIKPCFPHGSLRWRLLLRAVRSYNVAVRSCLLRMGMIDIPGQKSTYDGNYYQRLVEEWNQFTNLEPDFFDYEIPQTVSIVSILYNRAEQIEPFVTALARQSFKGQIELVMVDDLSPDRSVQRLHSALKGHSSQKMNLKLIKNHQNLGNCNSRNIGIEHSTGSIIIVIDSDCLVSKDFVRNHLFAHTFCDCSVVVGPILESRGLPPFVLLGHYERDLAKANENARRQDKILLESFLNCVPRNFSAKQNVLRNFPFDPDFSYSTSLESGFGWEDVETGYRLYKSGARIVHLPSAVSVHISHPSSVDETSKAFKSWMNFSKLFRKHPELFFVARRWAVSTFKIIAAWNNYNLPKTQPEWLQPKLSSSIAYSYLKPADRELRILTFPWHSAHQYELFKLPHSFTLTCGLPNDFARLWDYERRPFPNNAKFRDIREIDQREYDLAILHFDENVLAYENTNGILGSDWGSAFRRFHDNLEMPKIAICHGSPQFYGQYCNAYIPCDQIKIIEESRKQLVDYLGDILVVCNSYQAQREWNFKRSKVIWHGFDPCEFPPTIYEKGILSLGEPMQERPHYRGYFLYRDVVERLPAECQPTRLSVPRPSGRMRRRSNIYARAKFGNYVDILRQYSIYFNPTWRSPMPRSRGEAMMCGLAPVSTDNHDADMFINRGVNGFYSNDPAELSDYLLYLLRNQKECEKIGHAARMTAIDIFNHDRYLTEWQETLKELIGSRRGGT
jgi:glycosyltransferase involved in cell wall biosynthesis